MPTITVKIDVGNGKVKVYKNGALQGSVDGTGSSQNFTFAVGDTFDFKAYNQYLGYIFKNFCRVIPLWPDECTTANPFSGTITDASDHTINVTFDTISTIELELTRPTGNANTGTVRIDRYPGGPTTGGDWIYLGDLLLNDMITSFFMNPGDWFLLTATPASGYAFVKFCQLRISPIQCFTDNPSGYLVPSNANTTSTLETTFALLTGTTSSTSSGTTSSGTTSSGTTSGGGTTSSNTGSISGNVKDSSNNNLSGVTVTDGTPSRNATTDTNGNYTISNVPVGTYSVTASKTGFLSGTITSVTVTTGHNNPNQNFVLSPSSGDTHKECIDSICQEVDGTGTDECNTIGQTCSTEGGGGGSSSAVWIIGGIAVLGLAYYLTRPKVKAKD